MEQVAAGHDAPALVFIYEIKLANRALSVPKTLAGREIRNRHVGRVLFLVEDLSLCASEDGLRLFLLLLFGHPIRLIGLLYLKQSSHLGDLIILHSFDLLAIHDPRYNLANVMIHDAAVVALVLAQLVLKFLLPVPV